MERSQFWLLTLCSWLFFLYNIERLSEPINLASFHYVFVIVCANLVILIPWLRRTPFYKSLLLALPPFFALKVYFGYEIAGTNLPITVTEISAIGITIFLTRQVVSYLEQFHDIISRLTIGRLEMGTHTFEEGQGHLYREIRRARVYKRPAALLAISIDEASADVSLSHFVRDAQEKIIRRYIAARTASLLVHDLQDCDVITKRNDHFIVLLPETDRQIAMKVAARLRKEFRQKLGLEPRFGLSTFPDEAVTFESLLSLAESAMNGSQAAMDGQGDRVVTAQDSDHSANGPAVPAGDDVEKERENQWNSVS